MKGVTFGTYHSYDDFSLILKSKEIAAPKTKTVKIDIEGADSAIDLTEFFGEPKYEDCTHKFQFSTIVPQNEFLTLFSTIKNAIHGKKMRIILDGDPLFYYVGRCFVSSTDWTQLQAGTDLTLSKTIITEALFGVDSAYDVRLSVTDYFTTVRKTVEIPTAFTLLDFNASGKGLAFGKVSELTNGMEIDLDMSIYRNIFMGGSKRSDDEKNMYFQATDAAQYPHNCKLYGGNGASTTSIGCWDSARSHGIWRYLSNTQNLVFDANVRVTRGNGGDEFVTSDPVVHGNRTGRVHFSNGLLIQWGTESITPVANTPTAKAVKFPVAYTDTPIVLTTAQTTVPGTIVSGDAAASITTTGFDCYVTRNSTTNTSVGWVAIGYKA